MGRFLAMVVLGSVVVGQMAFADTKPDQTAPKLPASASSTSPTARPGLPPPPPGKSTVIGGSIHDVDPVRDQFTLKVFGGKRMKILYDQRTQYFQNGKRVPLRDLRADNHASVETVLDGTTIFARSIHTLSQTPEGECQGQVLKFDSSTGELAVKAALSDEPIILQVPSGAQFVRSAADAAATSALPSGPASLVKGALVSIKFVAGTKGRGVARQIEILATPGSSFVFSGNISFLDLHSGLLVVVDPRDGSTYKISFEPSQFPVSRKLHQGDTVRVKAEFNGSNYVASEINVK